MNNIDEQIKNLQQRINKQEKLLLQSKQLNSNILSRLSNLKNSNQELRDKLLESLGSEL